MSAESIVEQGILPNMYNDLKTQHYNLLSIYYLKLFVKIIGIFVIFVLFYIGLLSESSELTALPLITLAFGLFNFIKTLLAVKSVNKDFNARFRELVSEEQIQKTENQDDSNSEDNEVTDKVFQRSSSHVADKKLVAKDQIYSKNEYRFYVDFTCLIISDAIILIVNTFGLMIVRVNGYTNSFEVVLFSLSTTVAVLAVECVYLIGKKHFEEGNIKTLIKNQLEFTQNFQAEGGAMEKEKTEKTEYELKTSEDDLPNNNGFNENPQILRPSTEFLENSEVTSDGYIEERSLNFEENETYSVESAICDETEKNTQTELYDEDHSMVAGAEQRQDSQERVDNVYSSAEVDGRGEHENIEGFEAPETGESFPEEGKTDFASHQESDRDDAGTSDTEMSVQSEGKNDEGPNDGSKIPTCAMSQNSEETDRNRKDPISSTDNCVEQGANLNGQEFNGVSNAQQMSSIGQEIDGINESNTSKQNSDIKGKDDRKTLDGSNESPDLEGNDETNASDGVHRPKSDENAKSETEAGSSQTVPPGTMKMDEKDDKTVFDGSNESPELEENGNAKTSEVVNGAKFNRNAAPETEADSSQGVAQGDMELKEKDDGKVLGGSNKIPELEENDGTTSSDGVHRLKSDENAKSETEAGSSQIVPPGTMKMDEKDNKTVFDGSNESPELEENGNPKTSEVVNGAKFNRNAAPETEADSIQGVAQGDMELKAKDDGKVPGGSNKIPELEKNDGTTDSDGVHRPKSDENAKSETKAGSSQTVPPGTMKMDEKDDKTVFDGSSEIPELEENDNAKASEGINGPNCNGNARLETEADSSQGVPPGAMELDAKDDRKALDGYVENAELEINDETKALDDVNGVKCDENANWESEAGSSEGIASVLLEEKPGFSIESSELEKNYDKNVVEGVVDVRKSIGSTNSETGVVSREEIPPNISKVDETDSRRELYVSEKCSEMEENDARRIAEGVNGPICDGNTKLKIEADTSQEVSSGAIKVEGINDRKGLDESKGKKSLENVNCLKSDGGEKLETKANSNEVPLNVSKITVRKEPLKKVFFKGSSKRKENDKKKAAEGINGLKCDGNAKSKTETDSSAVIFSNVPNVEEKELRKDPNVFNKRSELEGNDENKSLEIVNVLKYNGNSKSETMVDSNQGVPAGAIDTVYKDKQALTRPFPSDIDNTEHLPQAGFLSKIKLVQGTFNLCLDIGRDTDISFDYTCNIKETSANGIKTLENTFKFNTNKNNI